MVYNPFEVLRKSESMCREIYGVLENNGERPDLAVWYQDVQDPDTLIIRMYAVSSRSIKGICAAGYYVHIFGVDYGAFELWISKID